MFPHPYHGEDVSERFSSRTGWSSHLPPVFVHAEDICCEPLFVENLSFHFQNIDFAKTCKHGSDREVLGFE